MKRCRLTILGATLVLLAGPAGAEGFRYQGQNNLSVGPGGGLSVGPGGGLSTGPGGGLSAGPGGGAAIATCGSGYVTVCGSQRFAPAIPFGVGRPGMPDQGRASFK
jgi:hypothetical protein